MRRHSMLQRFVFRFFVMVVLALLAGAGCFKPPEEPETPAPSLPVATPEPLETHALPSTGTMMPENDGEPRMEETPEILEEPEGAEEVIPEPEPGLSIENIARIHEGMNYQNVAMALGSPGLTIANDGASKTVYKWSQGEASFLGRFENGALVRKTIINIKPEDRAEGPELSESIYHDIVEGMSVEEVFALLDLKGQVVSDNTPGVTIYRWVDAKGTNFTARFEDGKLVRKTGLLVASLEKSPEEEATADEGAQHEEEAETAAEIPEEGETEAPTPPPKRIAPRPEPLEETIEEILPAPPEDPAPLPPPQRPRVHVAGSERRARAAEQDQSPVAGRSYKPRAKLPDMTFSLRRGAFEVRIHNTGSSPAEVGLRTGNRGRDLSIPAGGTRSVFVDSGSYQLFYLFKDAPYTLHQGAAIPIDGVFLSDTEVYLFDGGTDVRGLDYGYP